MRRLAALLAVGCACGLALIGASHGARGQRRAAFREAVSPIIFPEQERTLLFDHASESHRELRCEQCHVGATESTRADESLLPAERTCLPCHADQIARDGATVERCATCHVGATEGSVPVIPVSHAPTPRLRFSHRAHAREGMRCVECHRGLFDEGAPGSDLDPGRHLPTMRSCFRCHGGPSAEASTECTTCHLMLPDGRMRDEYPEGSLDPPEWLFGMHHDADFIVRHRWIAADQGAKCATCHAESECAECHDGRVSPPRVHPNDWLTVHAPAARRDEPRCTSCHTTQTFCAECHARLGTSTIAAPNVRSTMRFHPPAEVWTRGPMLHAREAQRSMTTCTSCHAERDCVVCHGASGVGAGISPHPPGFRRECGRLLRANDRACRVCHGDLGAVRALCN